MNLLLSTSSLQWYGLNRIFQFAKNAEYSGIDLSIDFSEFDTINLEYLKELQHSIGISIQSITAPERQVTTKQIEYCVTLASELWVDTVNVYPPHRLDKEKNWFWEYLVLLQQKHTNIIINIINAPPKTWLFVISEYGDARPETIKKMTEHTALSIHNVDSSSGVDLMRTFFLLGSTLGFVYLSDKKEEDDRLFPGEWLMPLESLLKKLHATEYVGKFSLQVDPKSLWAGNDEQVLKELIRAKNYIEHNFA